MKSVTEELLARNITTRLHAHGHAAYLVGGCVRDLLINRVPADFDVATSAAPEILCELFPGAGEVGSQFGVVLVHEAGVEVQVATFRSDLEYFDGRHPSGVRLESSPEADALRRDFTINALFLNPVTGAILDFTNGREDLKQRIIRAVGDPEKRFAEDHLRLLRAVRFAARLGFEIEPATFAAIQKLAPQIRTVAAERVRDEVLRILTEGGARRGFELLDSTGLLQQIMAEVSAMKGVEQPPEFHPEGDVWVHTLTMLHGLVKPTPTLAIGVLLHDVGKPSVFRRADRIRFDGHVEKGVELTHAILNRLCFSASDTAAVENLVANHMKFMDVTKMKESTLKRFIRQPDFHEHMELHRLDCLSSHGSLTNYDFIRQKLMELDEHQLRPVPLITGRSLIDAGYSPGPRFKNALRIVEDAQLEGRISTAVEALALAAEELNRR